MNSISLKLPFSSITALFYGSVLIAPFCQAATVSDPSTLWTTFQGTYDFLSDQQTGVTAGDIVGSGTNRGFFVTFNNNGPSSNTDGTLGFRIRLDSAGGNTNNPAFDRVAFIGIDGDIDGDIDAFLGLNLQGNSAEIGIHSAGTGSNTSPSTTTITSTPATRYSLTAANYNYRPVNFLTDGGTTSDVTTTTTGDPDYYVSFMVPFADVVAFLNTKSISINDQSPLRYVVATSTQTNSLNQDLGGVNSGINSSTTWVALGGFSQIVTASGTVIPEPSSLLLLFTSVVGFCAIRRR